LIANVKFRRIFNFSRFCSWREGLKWRTTCDRQQVCSLIPNCNIWLPGVYYNKGPAFPKRSYCSLALYLEMKTSVSESWYLTSDTVFVSEYLNLIFMMSISNRIISGIFYTIRIRIRIRTLIWKQIRYEWYPSVSDPFSSLAIPIYQHQSCTTSNDYRKKGHSLFILLEMLWVIDLVFILFFFCSWLDPPWCLFAIYNIAKFHLQLQLY
jgi:hypothetical protein